VSRGIVDGTQRQVLDVVPGAAIAHRTLSIGAVAVLVRFSSVAV
jgi:hypothetical protein